MDIYVHIFIFERPHLYLVKHSEGIRSFGEHLREIRAKRGISQQELADISNIAMKTVYRIEKAEFAVTLDVLLSLSEGLEIPLKDLLDFPVKPNQKS